MRGWLRRTLAGLLLACVLPAQAQSQSRPWSDPDLIVGRADADASGGWPVALLVINGAKRTLTVRAAREQLGELPGREWRPVDAEALMSLERYGAPQLISRPEFDGCPSDLNWGRGVVFPPSDYNRPQRPELAHAACTGPRCQGDAAAWQIELVEADGPGLALARLLPQLGRASAERLVLYVAATAHLVRVQGVKHLAPPQRRELGKSLMTPEYWLPAAAASQFPAIHAALLDDYRKRQAFAEASIVELADPAGPVGPMRFALRWDASPEQREALGLEDASLLNHYLTRLQLHLQPGDPIERLHFSVATDYVRFADFNALVPATAGVAACERAQRALQCVPACKERKAQMQANPRNHFPIDESSSCEAACERQKVESLAAARRYYGTVAADRQRQGWKNVELMTGRPEAQWRRPGATPPP